MARRKIREGHLGDMAYKAEMDHEVQMARSDLYKIAKYAVELHDMLKGVSEAEGIEGWQQSKITKAADYIGSVYHSMDYEAHVESQEASDEMPIAEDLRADIAARANAAGRRAAAAAGTAVAAVRKATRRKSIKELEIENSSALDALGKNLKIRWTGAKTFNNRQDAKKAMDKLDSMLRKGLFKTYNTGDGKAKRMFNKLYDTVEELEKMPGQAITDAGTNMQYKNKIRAASIQLKRSTEFANELIDETLKNKDKADATVAAWAMAMFGAWWLIHEAAKRLKDDDNVEIDEDDVEEGNEFSGALAQAKKDGKDEFEVDGKTYKVQEGKKKAKPDYLDFDGDGNKKETMKKALKDKKKSANESMLRTITQAINYKAGKIGAANVTPKAMNLAETMITKDLKRLHADFKKKFIAEESAVDRGNACLKLTGMSPQSPEWLKLSDGQKLDCHKEAEALIKQYGAGGVPQPKIAELQAKYFSNKQVNEGQYGEITHTDEDATQSEVLVKGMGVYRMDQLEQRLKDRLNNVLQLIDRGEPDQAAKLLDPNSSTYKSLMVMMNAFAEAHDELAFGDHSMGAGINESADVCEECGKPSWRTMSREELDEAHGNDSRYDKCWKGCRKVPGKKRGEKGSCKCP